MAELPQASQTQQGNPVVSEPGIVDEEITDNFDAHAVNNYYSQNISSTTKFTFYDIPPNLWKVSKIAKAKYDLFYGHNIFFFGKNCRFSQRLV